MPPTLESNGQSDDSLPEEGRAFLAIRHGDRTFVADLKSGTEQTLGRDPGAGIRVDDERVAAKHATFTWDGSKIALRDEGGGVFLNGKRLEVGDAELKPGDELALGPVQVVVGLSIRPTAVGRRALTHGEFRERLWEEVARSLRAGRQVALAMVQARPGEGGRVAATALMSLRAGDLLGTYAHDELEFLLPDTSAEVGYSVLTRILAAGGHRAAVGIAVAPQNGDNPERLLRAARSALSDAQNGGSGYGTPPPRVAADIAPTVHDESTKHLVAALTEVGESSRPVLLTGEVSSGKGVFARLIHASSARASGPFVTINCAALGGEADGAFDNGGHALDAADRARGGTLLLDEVGDLPEPAQKRLLSWLEATGDDLRVVSTTHRALMGLVERGAFERKLYDRLAGETFEVPALRNRSDDLLPLAERFALEFGAPPPVRFSLGALARLRSYPWPGNILELRNAMERAVRLANGGEILAEHLPSEVLPVASGEGRLREHVDSVERDAIVKALADANHNQTHAAKRLGISRRALIYKMEKYGLKPPPGTVRRT